MKHLKLLLGIMLTFVGVTLTSCSNDDDDNGGADSLIGTWKMVKYIEKEDGKTLQTLTSTEDITKDGIYAWLTVEKDMLYMSSSVDMDKDEDEEPYTYTVSGDKLILTDADSDHPYTWTLQYSFDNGQLVLYSSEDDDEDGLYEEYRYYEKVK